MYAEILERIIKECDKYSDTHYGVKHGADYVQIMLDIMASENVRMTAGLDVMTLAMMLEVAVATNQISVEDKNAVHKILSLPRVGESIVKWFYYGMQVGKSVAETEMLEKLHKE